MRFSYSLTGSRSRPRALLAASPIAVLVLSSFEGTLGDSLGEELIKDFR